MRTLRSATSPVLRTTKVSVYGLPCRTDRGLPGRHGGSTGPQSLVRSIAGRVCTWQVAVTGGRGAQLVKIASRQGAGVRVKGGAFIRLPPAPPGGRASAGIGSGNGPPQAAPGAAGRYLPG